MHYINNLREYAKKSTTQLFLIYRPLTGLAQ